MKISERSKEKAMGGKEKTKKRAENKSVRDRKRKMERKRERKMKNGKSGFRNC